MEFYNVAYVICVTFINIWMFNCLYNGKLNVKHPKDFTNLLIAYNIYEIMQHVKNTELECENFEIFYEKFKEHCFLLFDNNKQLSISNILFVVNYINARNIRIYKKLASDTKILTDQLVTMNVINTIKPFKKDYIFYDD